MCFNFIISIKIKAIILLKHGFSVKPVLLSSKYSHVLKREELHANENQIFAAFAVHQILIFEDIGIKIVIISWESD